MEKLEECPAIFWIAAIYLTTAAMEGLSEIRIPQQKKTLPPKRQGQLNGVGTTSSGEVSRPAVDSFNSPRSYVNPLAVVSPTV